MAREEHFPAKGLGHSFDLWEALDSIFSTINK